MVANPTPIYHITHIDNLPKIIASCGLCCCSQVLKDGIGYTNIAYQSVQDRRSATNVPLPPFGTLHDYVPFYFSPRSPMLYTINHGNVQGYSGGQREIVHLVSSVKDVVGAGIPFVFTDGHGIMLYTEFYNNLEDLDKIDWNIMKAIYWHDTKEDGDRLRRRQAEFLVHKFFQWSLIHEIGVINQRTARMVQEVLGKTKITPTVVARPE